MQLTIIDAREREVGGLPVLRPLPTRQCRSVGPFVFLDELGPTVLPAGVGLDVRPHPHIGLSTLTYRLTGELVHRDSLGCTQVIRPGEVNWMTAGRGVTHSERSAESERCPEIVVHGVQLWAALEPAMEDCEPSFEHHGGDAIPCFEDGPVAVRLIAGTGFGLRSPVSVTSPTVCADLSWQRDGSMRVETGHDEQAVYPLQGSLDVNGSPLGRGQLAVLADGSAMDLSAAVGTRALLIGGAHRRAPLHMHWNYVSSSKSRLVEARRRWASGEFPAVLGDDDLPEPDPNP